MPLHPFKVGDSTWIVRADHEDNIQLFERKVVRVSAKQLEINGPEGRVIHRPIGLDANDGLATFAQSNDQRWSPIVFATKQAALEMFIAQRETDEARALRRIEQARLLQLNAIKLLDEIEEERLQAEAKAKGMTYQG